MTHEDVQRLLADPEIPDRAKAAIHSSFEAGIQFAEMAFHTEWDLWIMNLTKNNDWSWNPDEVYKKLSEGVLKRANKEAR